MPKIKDLILSLAKKAGIENDQELALALSGSDLDKFELPESASKKLGSLLSESEAVEYGKNNLTVKNHHIGTFSVGLEENMLAKLKALGVSQEKLAEWKAIQSTGQKSDKAFELLNEILVAEKSKKGGSEEAVRQIAELQKQLEGMKDETEKRIGETKSQYEARMADLAMKTNLGFNWNPAIPEFSRATVYREAINAEIEKHGGKLKFNSETGEFSIVSKADETLPVQVGGKQLAYNDVHLLALQTHKLVSESGTGGNGGGSNDNPGFVPPNPGAGTPKISASAQAVLDKVNDSFAAYEKANS